MSRCRRIDGQSACGRSQDCGSTPDRSEKRGAEPDRQRSCCAHLEPELQGRTSRPCRGIHSWPRREGRRAGRPCASLPRRARLPGRGYGDEGECSGRAPRPQRILRERYSFPQFVKSPLRVPSGLHHARTVGHGGEAVPPTPSRGASELRPDICCSPGSSRS